MDEYNYNLKELIQSRHRDYTEDFQDYYNPDYPK